MWMFVYSAPVFGQVEEANRLFDEGNRMYREGQYQEAIDVYERAQAAGYTSGALNYNLGNAYFRNDELGQAIRYYEKARFFMPENEELIHNLQFARAQTKNQFSQLPVPSWIRWWQLQVVRNGAFTFFIIGILFYVAAMSMLIHRIRTRTRNPWHRRARSAMLVLSILLLGGAFAASIQSEQLGKAVVVVDEVELMQEPTDAASSVETLFEGVVVDLLQEEAEWVEIRLPNGTRGWLGRSVIADV